MMADRTLQRLIHVGCRELGIDAEMRHDLQLIITGKASMSDMTDLDLNKVVAALKERGFKSFEGRSSKVAKQPLKGRSKPLAPRADLRFIHVMWKLLGEASVLREPGRSGLNSFIRVQFEAKWKTVPIDIDALRDTGQIDDVVQALKAMCRRNGVPLK